MSIDRKQFLTFVSYFGNDLAFRCINDKGKTYEQTMSEIGIPNAINLPIKKVDLEKMIQTLEFYNQNEYAIHILPNGTNKKEHLKTIKALPFDFDCGKEKHDIKLDEKMAFEDLMTKRDDVTTFSSTDFNTKSVYTVGLKPEEIAKRKKAFLDTHKDILEFALINESPNGFRGLFFLKSPLTYKENVYKSIQIAMITYLDADKAFISPTQPVRASGFYHNKQEPSLVQTIQLPKREVSLIEIEKWFSVDYKQTKFPTKPKKDSNEKRPLRKKKRELPESPQPTEVQEITYEEALEEISNRPFSDFFAEIENDSEPFHCLIHSDEKPSANIYFSTYNCFGCQYKGNKLALWLELYHDGNREYVHEAAMEMMETIGLKIVKSDFYTKEAEKYVSNIKWLARMDENLEETKIKMSVELPTLYTKFFRQTVRYEKNKEGEYVLENGEKVVDSITQNNRYRFLEILVNTGQVHLRDVGFDGSAIFFASRAYLAKKYLGLKSNDDSVQKEAFFTINRYLKQLELLGFITSVNIEDVPVKEREKALLHQKDNQNVIQFYTMADFTKCETLFEENAQKLKDVGFSSRVHSSARAITVNQGNDVRRRLYQSKKDREQLFTPKERSMINYITKEIDEKGYVLYTEIEKAALVYKGFCRIRNKPITKVIKKSERKDLLTLISKGKNGILESEGLVAARSSKKIADKFGYDAKENRNKQVIFKSQSFV